ncbi:MAG: hypothetical protein K0R10_47 [Alphaproteobacteria bacterium]|jgi:uncharacterized protein YacL|nr:hypothetical protein [Alphaproteobacteria bacterium]
MATTEKIMLPQHSYVEWTSIAAGTMLAVALSLVMLQFGAAVGIADFDNMRTNIPSREHMIYGTIYALLVQLFAFTIGGYVAGRMRAPVAGSPIHEREVRDGIHGVLVWATGTVVVAIVAYIAHMNVTQAEMELAKDVIQKRHTISVILAFAAASTSLVSGVAAFVAATKGGDHRDNTVDHSHQISFRAVKKKK